MATERARELKQIPIGIEATGKRKETDSMGEIDVPANHYWGAQTERRSSTLPLAMSVFPRRYFTLMDM